MDSDCETENSNERTPLIRQRSNVFKTPELLRRSGSIEERVTNIANTQKDFLSNKYQSLDYDRCENVLFQNEEKRKFYLDTYWQTCARWLVMLLIGIFTGLIAVLIDYSITILADWKFGLIQYTFSKYYKTRLWIPFLIWLGFNAIFVFVGSCVVTFGEPVAAGSGIPQIKCFLNGIKIPHVSRLTTLFCKVFGVVCSVVGGLAVGKEGPMIHSGAIVAAGISQGRTTSLNLDMRFFEYFRTDREKRDFVSAGAAAGVAAAFGAPIGGVLFSLEEGASFWNQALTWRILFTSIVSSFTLNVIQSFIHGLPWKLSYSGLINFGTFENMTYEGFELPIFLVMGMIGGFFGALFNFINIKLTKFRKNYIHLRLFKVFEVVLVALCSGVVSFILSFYWKDCQPLGKDPTEHLLQVDCPDGQYSTMSIMWLQTPESSVKSLFHDPPGSYHPETVMVFAICYFLLACWTYGLSISGGIFIPCLLTGAAWGRLIGIGLLYFFPTCTWINPGKYALIGAAAMLGGVVRMTISLTVILMEATGNIAFAVPIMIVLMVAKFIGDIFNKGIYDLHIEFFGVPILEWEPPHMSWNITAKEVMSYPIITLRPVEKVGLIADILMKYPYNGFPIVDTNVAHIAEHSGDHGFGYLRGVILRSQLIVLLQHKAFVQSGGTSNDTPTLLTAKDFRDFYPRFPRLTQISISIHERDALIDLRPIMNPAPYSVLENTSLPRIFQLFRGLGLRHLVVTNGFYEVLGIIARKDLARYKFHKKSGLLEELQISNI